MKNSAGILFNENTDLIIEADKDGTVTNCRNLINETEYVGGGSSDGFDGFHTATITITGMTYPSEDATPVDSVAVVASVYYYNEDGQYYDNYAQFYFCPVNGTTSFELPLKEGYSHMVLDIFGDSDNDGRLYMCDASSSSCSGNISYDNENYHFIVTGDGSINILWGYYD